MLLENFTKNMIIQLHIGSSVAMQKSHTRIVNTWFITLWEKVRKSRKAVEY